MREHPVTPAVRGAASWAWRILVIAGAIIAVAYLTGFVSEAVIPIVVATLMAALLWPFMQRLTQWFGGRRGPAAGVTVILTIAIVAGLLSLVMSQIAGGVGDMAGQVTQGIEQVRGWVRDTFHLSDGQLADYLDRARNAVTNGDALQGRVSKFGSSATHLLAGTFISLFALFFFLYEGERIWGWLVRLFPRATRGRVHSSGVVAWGQLTAFTRATVIVALVDALGIGIIAAILRVPFAPAIAVLVFLSSFIPIVGAFFSGLVAVLLALVAHGPVVALLMLGGVVLVQQVESHVLQPFLLGRAVNVHPLAVILAITVGVTVAGIVGALIAVPMAAVINAVIKHLVSHVDPEALEAPIADGEPGLGADPAR